MTTARRLHYSYGEYPAALEVSGVKLEYCDGEIYAVAGGTPAHADLAASITRLYRGRPDARRVGAARVSSGRILSLTEPRLGLGVDEVYAGIQLDGV